MEMDLSKFKNWKRQIQYVIEEHSPEDILEEVVAVIRPTKQFYRYGNELVRIKDHKLCRLTRSNLNAQFYDFLEIHFAHGKKDEAAKVTRIGMLQPELVAIFLENASIHAEFPQIKTFAAAPMFDVDWNFISTPGYDAESGIYYSGPKVELIEGTKKLEEAFSEFPWKSKADRVNYFGLLLTCLTMPRWILTGHPAGVFNGSGYEGGSGTGKSKLANAMALIIDGKEASKVSHEKGGEEFERKICAPILQWSRF